jgi:hypothetical protein
MSTIGESIGVATNRIRRLGWYRESRSWLCGGEDAFAVAKAEEEPEPREVVPEDKLVAYSSQTLARWHPEAAALAAQIKATKPAPAPSLP